MRSLVREAGLEDEFEIDSAGTGSWHAGDPPDARATESAGRRGITLEGAARQVLRHLASLWGYDVVLREFDPESAGAPDLDVPDPYYGGPRGFETVLDQVEAACRGLLAHVRASA